MHLERRRLTSFVQLGVMNGQGLQRAACLRVGLDRREGTVTYLI
jgi:hypothetical protein